MINPWLASVDLLRAGKASTSAAVMAAADDLSKRSLPIWQLRSVPTVAL